MLRFRNPTAFIRTASVLQLTLAALNGVEDDGLPEFFQITQDNLSDLAQAEPEDTAKKLQSAKDRYRFIGPSGP